MLAKVSDVGCIVLDVLRVRCIEVRCMESVQAFGLVLRSLCYLFPLSIPMLSPYGLS